MTNSLCAKKVAAACAAAAVLLGSTNPVLAAGSAQGAENLRRLDIMLMVTSLRCRASSDNFNVEYGRFTTSHMNELNRANAQLRASFAAQYGESGAARQLDRLSTVMANTYGQGHPWLSCAELKSVASDLADLRDESALADAADQLLGQERSPEMAYVRR